MAVQRSVITVSGKLDNQVYYQRNGKRFVRMAAAPYPLSENSKKSGTEFGRASIAASLVKEAFGYIINPVADKKVYNRLTSTFIKLIGTAHNKPKGEREVPDGDLALLKGFQFNTYTGSHKICSLEPEVTIHPRTGISVRLPRFNIKDIVTAPAGTGTLVIQLCCFVCDFATMGVVAESDYLLVDINKTFSPRSTAKFTVGVTDDETGAVNDKELPMNDKVVMAAIGFSFLDAFAIPIANRDWRAGSILEAALVREGRVVSFCYPEEKAAPAVAQVQKKRVSWEIEGEE
jgi:hypothetical protein